MSRSDQIDVERLRAELTEAGGLWRQVDLVAETGSTNDDLAALARRGHPPGLVLVTDHQATGRGRLGRTWTTPPGTGIAMSVLLRPQLDPTRWTWLPLLAGLAVAEGLRAIAHVPADLKWPNDVLVGEEKICGVLAERVETPDAPACVLGIGINVHLSAEQLPVPSATSLALLRPDRELSRTEIISTVLATFALLYRRWEADPIASGLAESYRARCATLGRSVELRVAGGVTVTGEAEAVDSDGRLVLLTGYGREVFAAGDVVHLR